MTGQQAPLKRRHLDVTATRTVLSVTAVGKCGAEHREDFTHTTPQTKQQAEEGGITRNGNWVGSYGKTAAISFLMEIQES